MDLGVDLRHDNLSHLDDWYFTTFFNYDHHTSRSRSLLTSPLPPHPTLRQVKLIMWDDMFRDARHETLALSQIGRFVEPMVWRYTPTLNLPADIWDRYANIFDSVWVASAFKGRLHDRL